MIARSIQTLLLMNDRRLYTLLTLTGATPFLAAALLPPLGYAAVDPFGSLVDAGLSYGLAIICFLAGIHWATYLYGVRTDTGNLLIVSNLIVLAVWVPYLFAPVPVVAGCMIAAFLALLFIDFRLKGKGVIEGHYLAIRSTATTLVVVSLAFIAVT